MGAFHITRLDDITHAKRSVEGHHDTCQKVFNLNL